MDTLLRRGAWYRVDSLTGLEVTVVIDWKPVSVPGSLVEIRDSPPREWTVVRREIVPARTQVITPNGYIVCPACGRRLVLPPAQVREQVCQHCGGIFPIAWDEKYLGRP